MKVIKREKCPKCKSEHIHTLGVDQFCLDCDWMNTAYVVNSGLFEAEMAAEEERLQAEIRNAQPPKISAQGEKSLGSTITTKTA